MRIVIGGLLLLPGSTFSPAIGGEALSPLDQSPERLKEIIDFGKVCTWRTDPGGYRCYIPRPHSWHVNFDKNGRTTTVEFNAHVGYLNESLDVKPDSIADQAAVTEAVARLFPEWAESRSWMASMFKGARAHRFRDETTAGYLTDVRVGETYIYVVTHYSGSGQPDALIAEIEITREKWCKVIPTFDDRPRYYGTPDPNKSERCAVQ